MLNEEKHKWTFIDRNEGGVYFPEVGKPVWALAEEDIIESPEKHEDSPFVIKLILARTDSKLPEFKWIVVGPVKEEIFGQDRPVSVIAWRYVI